MRKDWNSYVGRKFDMLTVAGVIAPAMAQKMLNLSYKQTHFVCVCDCGAVRYAAAVAVERGYITSCGSDECKNKIKKSKRAATRAKVKITDKKPLLPLLKPEEEWSYKGRLLSALNQSGSVSALLQTALSTNFAICAAKSATAVVTMTYAATVRRNAETAD